MPRVPPEESTGVAAAQLCQSAKTTKPFGLRRDGVVKCSNNHTGNQLMEITINNLYIRASIMLKRCELCASIMWIKWWSNASRSWWAFWQSWSKLRYWYEKLVLVVLIFIIKVPYNKPLSNLNHSVFRVKYQTLALQGLALIFYCKKAQGKIGTN